MRIKQTLCIMVLSRLLIVALLITYVQVIFAQEFRDDNDLLISGSVRDNVSQENIPFAHIFVNKKPLGAANKDGNFQFLAGKNDTIVVKHISYESATVLIDTVEVFSFNILMKRHTIEMDEARIVPYQNYSEFKDAFIKMGQLSSKTQSINNNLTHPQKLKELPPSDAYLNFKNEMQMKDGNNNSFMILSTDRNKGLWGLIRKIF